MLFAMTHPDHGVHVVYSFDEQKQCEERGWKHDRELSKSLSGEAPIEKSLIDKYKDKFGKAPHHLMKADTIQKALDE